MHSLTATIIEWKTNSFSFQHPHHIHQQDASQRTHNEDGKKINHPDGLMSTQPGVICNREDEQQGEYGPFSFFHGVRI